MWRFWIIHGYYYYYYHHHHHHHHHHPHSFTSKQFSFFPTGYRSHWPNTSHSLYWQKLFMWHLRSITPSCIRIYRPGWRFEQILSVRVIFWYNNCWNSWVTHYNITVLTYSEFTVRFFKYVAQLLHLCAKLHPSIRTCIYRISSPIRRKVCVKNFINQRRNVL